MADPAAAAAAGARTTGCGPRTCGPELGGQGYGQVKLALLNEILGRSRWAPSVFGCQAPDSGNAEILALFGTEEQKQRYLQPLLDGEISSCYSMTEPQGGSDPGLFVTRARTRRRRVGDQRREVVLLQRPARVVLHRHGGDQPRGPYPRQDVDVHRARRDARASRSSATSASAASRRTTASHGYVRYNDVRVPADHVLGGEGQAFVIAQTRLGGGRVHHAMRTIALARRAFDMMCERAVSRQTRARARWPTSR